MPGDGRPDAGAVLLAPRCARAGVGGGAAGRSGGYRLSRKPAAISLVEVLRGGGRSAADPVQPEPLQIQYRISLRVKC